jgi:hypothetical protein
VIGATGNDKHGNTYYFLDAAWTTNGQAQLLDSNWSGLPEVLEGDGHVYYTAVAVRGGAQQEQ